MEIIDTSLDRHKQCGLQSIFDIKAIYKLGINRCILFS